MRDAKVFPNFFSSKTPKPLDEIKFLGRLLSVVMTTPEGFVAD